MNVHFLLDNMIYAVIYTLEIIAVFSVLSMLLSTIEKINSSAIYNTFGMKGLVITGLIGTIIHEFSHMIFCLIFRHNIVEFSLFRPFKSRYDGVMGYVNHTFNPRSYYQTVGNFFIGIAPIIIGTIVMILSMWILLPEDFTFLQSSFAKYISYLANINNLKDGINIYISMVLILISSLNPFRQENYLWYILFIFIMISITTHMDLSKEDIKNSKVGFLSFALLLLIINFILSVMGMRYQIIMLKIVIISLAFLTISLTFAIVTTLVTKILELFLSR